MIEVISKYDSDCVKVACDFLNKGSIIIVPTIRWYMIATLAENEKGVNEIFKAKDRERARQPLFVVPSEKMIKDFFVTDKYVQKIMNDFWPGELSLKLKWKNYDVASMFSVNKDAALTYCPTGVFGEILRLINKPVAATTPNISSDSKSTPALCVDEAKQFVIKTCVPVELIIDGGYSVASMPTSILDCTVQNVIPQIIREGFICNRVINASLSNI